MQQTLVIAFPWVSHGLVQIFSHDFWYWRWRSYGMALALRMAAVHPRVAVQFAVDAVQIHGEDGVGAGGCGVHIGGTDLG